ncbi:hypothetical protein Hanom_Chr15g01406271 [Helianthus anomalus]
MIINTSSSYLQARKALNKSLMSVIEKINESSGGEGLLVAMLSNEVEKKVKLSEPQIADNIINSPMKTEHTNHTWQLLKLIFRNSFFYSVFILTSNGIAYRN